MITLLGYSIAYTLTGYLVFLKWIRMSPPREGEFEHESNSFNPAMVGWYVPALIASERMWGKDRGMRLGYVLWMSVTAWPLVFIVSIFRICLDQIFAVAAGINKFGTRITHFLAHFTDRESPKELEEQPKDPEMIIAEQEVEEICI